MPDRTAELSIRDLSFRFPSFPDGPGVAVFEALSLSLASGRVTVVLGAADAGKTTLSRILAGSVPRFTGGELEGSIEMGLVDLRAMPPYERMEKIGLVAQNSDEQIFTTRCDTEVAFALESLGVPRAQMIERVEESLRLVDLSGRRAQNPSTLSGGEKKRLLLACLAAISPRVWVLDEALPELDRAWRARILDMMAAREATVLLLDSRLSALHEERGDLFGVISGRRMAGLSADCRSAAIRDAARAEGIVPELEARRTRGGGGASARGSKFLRAEGIEVRFPGEEGFSLDIDSLELEKGAVCSLLGRNGSGKSTLGRVLCGLLQPRAGGVSLWTGSSFQRAAAPDLNRRVGYLFQNPDHQIFLPTVFEELALGLRRQGIGEAETRGRVEEACRLFDLPDPAALPSLMSFGARRRLQAATYHLLGREFLILDEVDTGLSYRDLDALLACLTSPGTGILLITHDTALARDVSDRIFVLSSGKLSAELAPADFDRLDALLEEI